MTSASTTTYKKITSGNNGHHHRAVIRRQMSSGVIELWTKIFLAFHLIAQFLFLGGEPSVLLNCFSFCTEWVGLHCYVTTVNSLVETYWCSNFCQRGETLFSAYFFFFFFFPPPCKKGVKIAMFSVLAGRRTSRAFVLASFPHLHSLALPSSFPASSPTLTCLHVHHTQVEDSFCDCFLWLLSVCSTGHFGDFGFVQIIQAWMEGLLACVCNTDMILFKLCLQDGSNYAVILVVAFFCTGFSFRLDCCYHELS